MRRLIVCCDGTWNSPKNKDGDLLAPTNVIKFHAEIAKEDADGNEQIPFYRTGVGTLGNPLKKLLGGALGYKLEDDIKSAYKFLAETWKPGDEIYLLGFSRGAYTARSVAGLLGSIGLCNLTDPDLSDETKWANAHAALLRFQLKKSNGRSVLLNQEKRQGKDKITVDLHSPDQVPIRFLGVWDTVGSLGVPDDLGLTKLIIGDLRSNRFLDTKLGDGVQTARHALAIDEQRIDFVPTLWTGHDPGRDIRQVWFAGVHGDVGGSYADHRLGDITLNWMIEEAFACGLAFRNGTQPSPPSLKCDPRGRIHDSVSGIFKHRVTRPRGLPSFTAGKDQLTEISKEAMQRHKQPAVGETDYWKTRRLSAVGDETEISVHARERWNRSGLFVRAGEHYEVSARGEWRDAHIKASPNGAYNSIRLGYFLAGIPEGMRAGLRKIPRTRSADNRWSRRHAGARWFSLVGVVANGRGVSAGKSQLNRHQPEEIGEKGLLKPDDDGYLYFYANDVWALYDNNSGALRVKIKRMK
ncbi:DUF2235 domain-containing protein [Ruegeria marisrubri]|uniref:DUF2235 domain-containing protein n=1 Tax=Ruegeria marisrubri TaxID=1685379 RepID=UPI001CD28823|nr:DUF2235 domain-containing protein [Ruegeria marisrubri]MCA0906361.1 DUF2235 domain-containing protein [Ruegeria marisrubri]